MKNIRVSLIQITSGDDLESNLSKIRRMVDSEYSHRIFSREVDASLEYPVLVCLPENFAFFGEEEVKLKNLHEFAENIEVFLSELSSSYGIFVLGGGYPYPSNSMKDREVKYFNQASIYNPNGSQIFRYRKIHLFDTDPGDGILYKESYCTIPGDSIPDIINMGDHCKLTSFICYDLRFPEVFRQVSSIGAEVICLPAAFTVPTGIAHWEVLLRARAIENFCYILAPAQVGENWKNGKKSRKTYGNSMAIDPWGRILGRLDSEEEGILNLELDGNVLSESRKKIPALNHRRF